MVRSDPSRPGELPGLDLPGTVVLVERVGDLRDVLVQLVVGHRRIDRAQLAHRAVAILQLGERLRPAGVLSRPVEPGGHPDGEGLGPVLVGVLLGVPARQVADVAAAERLGAVLLPVGPGHRAEPAHPVLPVVEPVGVVDHVPHLVPQVAQEVPAAEPLDVAGPLGVERRQVRRGRDRTGSRWRPSRTAPPTRSRGRSAGAPGGCRPSRAPARTRRSPAPGASPRSSGRGRGWGVPRGELPGRRRSGGPWPYSS